MSALFRQHVCCRHAPETNPLFTPPLPPLPPSIPPSIPSIFVLRTSRLPGCWREPQVNKKTGEGRERAGWGWVVGVWGGDPDGATDVLAAAALLCRQTGSSVLGLSALLPSPSLCSALLFSLLLLWLLLCSFCSVLLFWGHFSSGLFSSNDLCSCPSPPTLALLCWWGARWHSKKEMPSFSWKMRVQDLVPAKIPPVEVSLRKRLKASQLKGCDSVADPDQLCCFAPYSSGYSDSVCCILFSSALLRSGLCV